MNSGIAGERYINATVLLLVGLFPVVSATIKDAGSAIYSILFLLSLVYGWPAWKKLSKDEKVILLGFIGFLLAISLSLVNTDNWYQAGKKVERFLRILAIVPIYLLLRRLNVSVYKSFAIGAAIGCVAMAMQAGLALQQGHSIVEGAYHKIVFGDVAMLLVVIVAAMLLTVAKEKWHFIVGLICIILGVSASISSMTRGAWIVLPLLLPVLIFLYRRTLTIRHYSIVGSILIVVCIIGYLWMPATMERGIDAGIDDLKGYQADPARQSSWGARLNMWRDSITLFKKHPVVGVGIGDFKLDRQKLINTGDARKGYGYGHAHSIYFQALATTGLIGFLALIVCFFMLPLWFCFELWAKWQHNGWYRFALLGGISTILSFAIFGMSEGWTMRNPFLNTYAMCVVVFLSSIANLRDSQAKSSPI